MCLEVRFRKVSKMPVSGPVYFTCHGLSSQAGPSLSSSNQYFIVLFPLSLPLLWPLLLLAHTIQPLSPCLSAILFTLLGKTSKIHSSHVTLGLKSCSSLPNAFRMETWLFMGYLKPDIFLPLFPLDFYRDLLLQPASHSRPPRHNFCFPEDPTYLHLLLYRHPVQPSRLISNAINYMKPFLLSQARTFSQYLSVCTLSRRNLAVEWSGENNTAVEAARTGFKSLSLHVTWATDQTILRSSVPHL